jgi:hypothetical protein
MHRDKYPERVPFRLTRMLVNAMEVSGIEGTFRSTCESVMRLLRKNKNSVMAVLEAFVYDPLINWRLLDKTKKRPDKTAPGNVTVVQVGGAKNERVAAPAQIAAPVPAARGHQHVNGNYRMPDGAAVFGDELEADAANAALLAGDLPQPDDEIGAVVDKRGARLESKVADDDDEKAPQAINGDADNDADGDPDDTAAGGDTGENGVAPGSLPDNDAEAALERRRRLADMAEEEENLSDNTGTSDVNDKALAVIARVESKLKGCDFADDAHAARKCTLARTRAPAGDSRYATAFLCVSFVPQRWMCRSKCSV